MLATETAADRDRDARRRRPGRGRRGGLDDRRDGARRIVGDRPASDRPATPVDADPSEPDAAIPARRPDAGRARASAGARRRRADGCPAWVAVPPVGRRGRAWRSRTIRSISRRSASATTDPDRGRSSGRLASSDRISASRSSEIQGLRPRGGSGIAEACCAMIDIDGP